MSSINQHKFFDMRKALLVSFLLSQIFYAANLHAQCSNGRYYNKIFSVQTTSGIVFGNAMKFDSTYQDLKVDIYEPKSDNFAHRPLIVLAFGGSFTAGSRVSPDIVNFCNEFAKRGYVTASIDYRLGFEGGNDSDTNQFKALMRGVQDMKAAVRFFYKDAQTDNAYRIDTTQIWIGGVSAGGVISLNYAYFKTDTTSRGPTPPWVPQAFIEVGGLEGNSGNPGYSEKVKGVINLSGAIADTVWIRPTDPIIVALHGDADSLVPCYYDSAKAAGSVEAMLYGSGDILKRVINVGLPHSIYIFHGAGHVPFIIPTAGNPNIFAYADTCVWTIRDFLYQNVVCDSELISGLQDVAANPVNVSLAPNPSDGNMTITSSSDKNYELDIFSVDGRLVRQGFLYANTTQQINIHETGAGVFFLRLTDIETKKAAGTLKAVFY
jgi:hypothetical protein